jgi:hypothetical protein
METFRSPNISMALVLSSEAKRWSWMQYKMREFPWKPKRHIAVTVDGFEWEKYAHMYKQRDGRYLINSRAALAILASWRTMTALFLQEMQSSSLLVLEDDVYFHVNFSRNLVLVADTLPSQKFDVIYIGANCWEPCNLKNRFHASHEDLSALHSGPLDVVEVDTEQPYSPVFGGFGLLLSRHFVKLLNDELTILENILLPIDDLIQDIYRRFQLKVGIAFPFLVIPETRDSANMADHHSNFASFVRERLHVPLLEHYEYVNSYVEMREASNDPLFRFPEGYPLRDFPFFYHRWFMVLIVLEESDGFTCPVFATIRDQKYRNFRTALLTLSENPHRSDVEEEYQRTFKNSSATAIFHQELRVKAKSSGKRLCEIGEIVLLLSCLNSINDDNAFRKMANSFAEDIQEFSLQLSNGLELRASRCGYLHGRSVRKFVKP